MVSTRRGEASGRRGEKRTKACELGRPRRGQLDIEGISLAEPQAWSRATYRYQYRLQRRELRQGRTVSADPGRERASVLDEPTRPLTEKRREARRWEELILFLRVALDAGESKGEPGKSTHSTERKAEAAT